MVFNYSEPLSMKNQNGNRSNMLNTGHQLEDDGPMPSDDEIDDLFSKVIATMDLPPDKSRVLWNYDKDRKWEIIKDQRKVHAKQEPKYYLSKLRSYMDPKSSRLSKRRKDPNLSCNSTQVLRDLEISLRTNSIDWVKEFLSEKNNGLDMLIDYLTFRLLILQNGLVEQKIDFVGSKLTESKLNQLTSTHKHLASSIQFFPKNHSQKLNLGTVEDDIHVCIMCIRSIMNNKKGFNMVMEHPQAINCISLSLNHNSIRTKTLVLELLAAICLVRGGHELTIAAYNNFKLLCHEKLRFETLIHYFKNQERFNVDFMVSCLQFINIIVHSVDDMNYRTHLQYEFTNLGLDEYLEKLKQNESEELQVQIQTYLDNRIDVSALAEEAEVKNNALEQVQQLMDKLSIANELQNNLQLNYQALDFKLREQTEEFAKERNSYKEQLARLNEVIEKQKSEAHDRLAGLVSKPDDNENPEFQGNTYSTGAVPIDGSTKIIIKSNSNKNRVAPQPPPPPPPPPPPSLPTIREIDYKGPAPPPPPPPPPSMPILQSPVQLSHKKNMAPQPPPMPSINQSQQALTTRQLQNLVGNEPSSLTKSNCDMMTLKKTFSTQYKLPTFNWLTLKPAQVRGTIFNEFHDEDKIIKSIDFKDFEEQFKLGNKSDSNKKRDDKIKHSNGNDSSLISNDDSRDCSQTYDANSLSNQSKKFKQPEKISFLEHNRLRNMAISLRKISQPTETLVSSVNNLEIDQLSLDSIEILMRMIPTPQETKSYREFEAQGKSLETLTDEDIFLCQVSKIDRFEQKIKIMFYMKNLELTPSSNSLSSSYSLSSSNTDSGDLLALTKSKLETIENAARSLRKSDGIRVLLEYILVFGNYLNSSSRSLASAPAYGYKLQALDMVTEAKSTQDKSRNLLHFIVMTILKNLSANDKAKLSPIDATNTNKPSTERSPRLIGGKRIPPLGAFDCESIKMPYDFDTLIMELEQAANASLETLISEVKEFERGIELCIKELHVRVKAAEAIDKSIKDSNKTSHHGMQSPTRQLGDETIGRLQKFIKSRSCDIAEVKEAAQRAQKEFDECAQFFGENPKTIESSSLFSIFLRHLKNFRQCQIDNKMIEKRKFDEELRKQIQLQQSLRLKKRTPTGSPRSEVPINGKENDVSHTGNCSLSPDLKDNRVLQQDEVNHGTLDILITGLKVEPYRRADGLRKSLRRMEHGSNRRL